jgi:hypothetical protein
MDDFRQGSWDSSAGPTAAVLFGIGGHAPAASDGDDDDDDGAVALPDPERGSVRRVCGKVLHERVLGDDHPRCWVGPQPAHRS